MDIPPTTTTTNPSVPPDECATDFSQATLFDDSPQLVGAARRYLHTGKTTSKDEELCRGILESWASGLMSQRAIARRLRVSRETIAVIVSEAERLGKVGPLKERLSLKLGKTIELTLEAMKDAVADGTMPKQSLPIVYGVLSDKKAMLDGEATVRIEAVAPRLTAQEVRAEFERMKRAIECESSVCPSAESVAAAAAATGTAAQALATIPEGGRGGSAAGAGAIGALASDGKNIEAKEGS